MKNGCKMAFYEWLHNIPNVAYSSGSKQFTSHYINVAQQQDFSKSTQTYRTSLINERSKQSTDLLHCLSLISKCGLPTTINNALALVTATLKRWDTQRHCISVAAQYTRHVHSAALGTNPVLEQICARRWHTVGVLFRLITPKQPLLYLPSDRHLWPQQSFLSSSDLFSIKARQQLKYRSELGVFNNTYANNQQDATTLRTVSLPWDCWGSQAYWSSPTVHVQCYCEQLK